VNLEELSKGIQGLGIKASEEEVKTIFDEVDVDKSGGIDSEEFVRCVIILYDRLEALEAEKHLQTL
jgi:Ca2+-binding EF-hand superfamily protein